MSIEGKMKFPQGKHVEFCLTDDQELYINGVYIIGYREGNGGEIGSISVQAGHHFNGNVFNEVGQGGYFDATGS